MFFDAFLCKFSSSLMIFYAFLCIFFGQLSLYFVYLPKFFGTLKVFSDFSVKFFGLLSRNDGLLSKFFGLLRKVFGSLTKFVEEHIHPSNPAPAMYRGYRGGNRFSVSPALAMTDKHLLLCGLKPKDGSDSVSPR